MPVYFVIRDRVTGMDEELLRLSLAKPCRDAQILEPTGSIRLSNGLHVGFISGISAQKSAFSSRHVLLSEEIFKLQTSAKDILDVLLTFEWPSRICEFSQLAPPAFYNFGSKEISDFLGAVPCRYIFSIGERRFFEREPFEILRDEKIGVSRFISLAQVGSTEKWYYAFNILPTEQILNDSNFVPKKPSNTTSNPFDRASIKSKGSLPVVPPSSPNYFFAIDSDNKRTAVEIETDAIESIKKGAIKKATPPEGYICKRCHSSEHFYRDCPHFVLSKDDHATYICHRCHQPGHNIKNCPLKPQTDYNAPSKAFDLSTCWFCLANPAIRKHLIISIGENIYLSLARGALTDDHLLLIPIEHVPGNSELSLELSKELLQFQDALASMYSSFKKAPVFFNLFQSPNHHWHMQSIPLGIDQLERFNKFLLSFFEESKYPLTVDPPTSSSYFQIQFKDVKLFHEFSAGSYFPTQIGRQVIAEFLGMKSLTDWRKTNRNENEELRLVSDFKSKFKNFDPANK